MALTYKTDQITLNAVNTDFTILTATASTTLVKNITWIHEDHNTNVILSLTKSGGTKTQIGTFSATADTPLKIWTDILPLEANDVLHLQSDHISSSDPGYVIVSYVEDTTSVAGQSIGVHTDVDITGITNGQILKWNASATEFQPGDDGGGLTNTDDLTEGSTNLYFTNARADARIAAANVTDLSDVTAAGSGSIITAAERSKLTGIETSATADQTDAEIKTAYENNADTNAFTDAEQTKLSGIATAATANDTDANLKARANHTGTQTASTISDFDTEVSNNATVAANAAKTSFPGFGTTSGTALEGDTSLLQLGTTSTTALAGNTAVILTVNDITADQDGAVEIGLSEVTAGGTGVLGGNINVGGYKITSSSNGDIDLEPNGTGDVLLGNFKFDADQSVGASQDNHVLTYDNSTGKISLEAAPSGSGSGSGGGVCTIATITGVFRPGSSSDNGEDNIVAGGFRGANWYSWNNDVFTAANAVSSGLGTPGTSTFSSGTGYHIANGMFYVPQAGTAKFSVQMEFDSASEVAGETWRFFMWKIGSDEVSAIENGNYDSSWSGTLVASATLTIPSSFQSIAPGAVVSTNGSSLAAGDYVFLTGVYDGTLTSTQDFPTNLGMYST